VSDSNVIKLTQPEPARLLDGKYMRETARVRCWAGHEAEVASFCKARRAEDRGTEQQRVVQPRPSPSVRS